MGMTIQSTAFGHGGPIPKKYTGDGADVSPPLAWSQVPAGAQELALICDDPDAPTPEPWVHWVIYQLSPDVTGLPEGVPTATRIDKPLVALQGRSSWQSSTGSHSGMWQAVRTMPRSAARRRDRCRRMLARSRKRA